MAVTSEQFERAQERLSRRAVLANAGRVALGAAAAGPLGGWLAACGEASSSSTTARVTSPSVPPTTAAAPEPTPAPTPDSRPVTLVITGDIMLGREVNAQMLASTDRFPFNGTADYLRGFDLTVGNLECVVSTLGQPVPNKTYHFRGDPRGFSRLTDAGFDIVSLANNHSGDYGTDAFADMLARLPEHGIAPLGGGLTLADAHAPVIKTVRTTAVGFLGYCEIAPSSFAATPTSPGHAWLVPALMQSDIAALRRRVNYLIVFTHWGIEYQHAQSGHQQAMARLAIDAGADLVVGAHPHVIQPDELYRGKPIVYSLGNFVFDGMWPDDTRRGNVLTLTLQGSQLLGWKLRQSYITGNFGQPQWV